MITVWLFEPPTCGTYELQQYCVHIDSQRDSLLGDPVSSSHVNQLAIFVHDADKIVSTQNLLSFIVTVQLVVNVGCS